MLAILLDQKIRAEGFIRTIYLYPMALSFIVTGTAWKWFLDPGIGLQAVVRSWGWESFTFEWIKDSDMAIYTIVIAAVWQTSGFVMAMFLAGLRGIDNEVMKAAQIDGASTLALYWRMVIPQLRPAFMSAFVVLAHMAIKSYDLVIALTGGGPGTATELPATFMYSYTFTRSQMGIGAARAVIMLMAIAAIMVPYHLVRAQGEEVMATCQAPPPASTGRPPAPQVIRTGAGARFVIYAILAIFCLYYLLPLYVMAVNSLKPLERDPGRRHDVAAAAVDARALAQGLVDGADRRRGDRAAAPTS